MIEIPRIPFSGLPNKVKKVIEKMLRDNIYLNMEALTITQIMFTVPLFEMPDDMKGCVKSAISSVKSGCRYGEEFDRRIDACVVYDEETKQDVVFFVRNQSYESGYYSDDDYTKKVMCGFYYSLADPGKEFMDKRAISIMNDSHQPE